MAESIQQLDRSGIPACDGGTVSKLTSVFRWSVTNFFSQNNLVKNKIIRAAGGNDAGASQIFAVPARPMVYF